MVAPVLLTSISVNLSASVQSTENITFYILLIFRALLRPGRFDVEVLVYPPDMKGRQEILEHYLKNIKVDNVDTSKLAAGTFGFTGADLENMVNQAALHAAIVGASHVTMEHIEFAKDKRLMGLYVLILIHINRTSTSYDVIG